jgi:hypothetical protein
VTGATGVVVGWVAGRVDEAGIAGLGLAGAEFVMGEGLPWAVRGTDDSNVTTAKPAAMRSRVGAERCIWL